MGEGVTAAPIIVPSRTDEGTSYIHQQLNRTNTATHPPYYDYELGPWEELKPLYGSMGRQAENAFDRTKMRRLRSKGSLFTVVYRPSFLPGEYAIL
ncbi:unnamed protein product [Prunus armeniaca]|uniref:Uncharacterized protein n=1 Tax=Prunus armeniaca TaxID=36596 RepID=A0A6J5TL65_PRUAR|nr:unnamed protein product [Prunus armeniaca]CAB4293936.1 unnamed protein product [Prunus armeniaca]